MASTLSPRQREILDLVAEGRTSKEIASALGISESTVNWHVANVFAKLGASSRAEAVARAYVANGHEPQRPPTPVTPVSTPKAWPRFVAITIAVAIAAALLGGATVATFRVGPVPIPTSPPANGSDRAPTPSPASGSREDVVGGEIVPVGGGVDVGSDPVGVGLVPESPATLLPAFSAPPLLSVSVPLPTPALPSLPVTTPPLLSLPVSAPTPVPTPRLSLP